MEKRPGNNKKLKC